jgi:hypothetical protein
MQKPRHGAAVQRGLVAINQALDKDALGSYLIADARRLGVSPADMRLAIRYLGSLAAWKAENQRDS